MKVGQSAGVYRDLLALKQNTSVEEKLRALVRNYERSLQFQEHPQNNGRSNQCIELIVSSTVKLSSWGVSVNSCVYFST